MTTIFLFILSVFLFAQSASAATYWVSQTGNDGNQHCVNSLTDPGNASKSRTIQQGIGCLASGDTLYIGPGTYREGLYARHNASGVCIISYCIPKGISVAQRTTVSAAPGFERQVIISNDQGHFAQFYLVWLAGYSSFIAIKGFVLYGGDQVYANGAAKNIIAFEEDAATYDHRTQIGYPHGTLIENNELSGSYASCLLGSMDNTIRYNRIHHCGSDAQFDHGVYMAHANLVEYNEIDHSIAIGMQSWSPECPPEQNCEQSLAPSVVRYNFTHDNASAGYALGSTAGAHQIYGNVSYNDLGGMAILGYPAQVYNNTIVSTTGGATYCFYGGGISNTLHNNICSGTFNLGAWYQQSVDSSNLATTSTNLFVSSTNFQLSTATGRDAGVAIANVPASAGPRPLGSNGTFSSPTGTIPTTWTVDAAGTARPQGATWDQGACEWFNGAGQCPNLVLGTTPPVGIASIEITGPVSGFHYITNTTPIQLSGVLSCPSGATPSTITWANDRGGSGGATFVGSAWTMTGSATLEAHRVNTITVTLTCTSGVPVTDALSIAYSPKRAVILYSLDENAGTTPQDLSGNANHGSFGASVAYTSTAQKYGASALDFSGGTLTVANSTTINEVIGGFTIMTWLNPDTIPAAPEAIFDTSGSIAAFLAQNFSGCATGALFASMTDTNGRFSSTCSPTVSVQIGQYSCMAVTYDGTALSTWLAAQLVSTTAMNYEFPQPIVNSLQIGNNSTPRPYDGKLDEFRLYNHALSQAEIETACVTPLGTPPPAPATSLSIGSVGVSIGDKELKLGF